VFLKELRETLREKRTLALLALFTLMYPVMLGYLLNQEIKRATKPERDGIEIAVIGASQAPDPDLAVQAAQHHRQGSGPARRSRHRRAAAGAHLSGGAAPVR
jgi:hypothetical protein